MSRAASNETAAHWWCGRCGRWEVCDDADLCVECRFMVGEPPPRSRDTDRAESEPGGLPAWALQDREWGPVLCLLTAPATVREGALRYVDLTAREIDWAGMLAASRHWSSSADLLARVAFNVWNGGSPDWLDPDDDRGPGSVSALLHRLDNANLGRVIEAMVLARRPRTVPPKTTASNGRVAEPGR